MFRTVAAAVLAATVLALQAQAQQLKDGSEGMGGAAGHAMPLPDMSRSMGAAPPPDFEGRSKAPKTKADCEKAKDLKWDAATKACVKKKP
jgi:hypothetical protein